MQPDLNPSAPPAFHKIGEYNFQRLCRDIFAEEETVATCDIFGWRGQRQKGIDLLAPRRDGVGNEVAQSSTSGLQRLRRPPTTSSSILRTGGTEV
jgi:hypothetical protein